VDKVEAGFFVTSVTSAIVLIAALMWLVMLH